MNKKHTNHNIFNESILEKSMMISFKQIGSNLKQLLEKQLIRQYEMKCIEEGYIQKDSINVISYSGGIVKGENIIFTVVFSCICLANSRSFSPLLLSVCIFNMFSS